MGRGGEQVRGVVVEAGKQTQSGKKSEGGLAVHKSKRNRAKLESMASVQRLIHQMTRSLRGHCFTPRLPRPLPLQPAGDGRWWKPTRNRCCACARRRCPSARQVRCRRCGLGVATRWVLLSFASHRFVSQFPPSFPRVRTIPILPECERT
jgi:hypothetical protein